MSSAEAKNALKQAPRWFLNLLAVIGIASIIHMIQRIDARLEKIENHIQREDEWRHKHELGHAELHSDMRILQEQIKKIN